MESIVDIAEFEEDARHNTNESYHSHVIVTHTHAFYIDANGCEHTVQTAHNTRHALAFPFGFVPNRF